MKTKIILIICFLSSFICFIPANSQIVVEEEASVIAQNWINIIIDQYGSWGNFDKATPGDIQKLERDGKPLGFYCPVNPEGFIVMSIRKELAPVKAYSARSDININLEEGISLLIKGCMEGIINIIENQYESIETVQTKDLVGILEINYSDAWHMVYTYTSGTFPLKNPKVTGKDNYQEGNVLLTSDWHQTEPYNDQCPVDTCSWYCNSNTNDVVGCVATAGAQITRYWNWPPYGVDSPYNDTYDWVNMPDDFLLCTWIADEVNATAELNAEIGQAVGMNYGCKGSSAYTSNMENVFEDHYRYSTACTRKNRSDYSANDWFDRIKYQINQNRPLQYRLYINHPVKPGGHSIVCDGWRETGSPITKQYHMNYGWGGPGDDIWYTLDALPWTILNDEFILEFIYPAQALGPFIAGDFNTSSFPYRYVDQDCQGSLATFYQGQFIQFLQEMKITGTSASYYIRFYGISTNNTILYSGGNKSRGAKIYSGGIRLQNGGTFKMY